MSGIPKTTLQSHSLKVTFTAEGSSSERTQSQTSKAKGQERSPEEARQRCLRVLSQCSKWHQHVGSVVYQEVVTEPKNPGFFWGGCWIQLWYSLPDMHPNSRLPERTQFAQKLEAQRVTGHRELFTSQAPDARQGQSF